MLFGASALYGAFTGVPYFLDSEIPAAVFLGLHLLITDPSTSPGTRSGKVVFGALYLFRGGSEPKCLDSVDADDSGVLDISDVVTLLHFLCLGGRNLPAPGTIHPWFDPSDDDISCD